MIYGEKDQLRKREKMLKLQYNAIERDIIQGQKALAQIRKELDLIDNILEVYQNDSRVK